MGNVVFAHAKPVEPIAIVGMAARLPEAPNLNAFWDLLRRGGHTVSDVLPEHLRGSADDLVGSFLTDIDEFDAEFFGFSERETVRMSPTQRLLFEVVWEALDDAGIPTDTLAGTRTSVITSCLVTPEYWNLLETNGMTDMYAVAGASFYSMAAGRVAYALDLRGPTMALEATCASSLLAVHTACANIRSGESTAAIVGTVNLQLGTGPTNAMSRGRVLSPSGACKFGDAEADGYVRGDGSFAIVLKPLSAALADNDRIYAAILGSGVSSNGRGAPTLVAPNASAQVQAITAAHKQAGVTAADIDYVEAHGAGTARGDHAELTALGSLLQQERDASDPCLIGSVKSNIGHTEGAAGMAGLVKTALAMANNTIPATLHVKRPNELFTDELPLSVVRHTRPWPNRGPTRVAGVSSLGLSGTNVHLVLGSVPEPAPRTEQIAPTAYVLPVSARTPRALQALATAYADQLDKVTTPQELRDVVYSAGARRTHYNHRIAAVGTTCAELSTALRTHAANLEARTKHPEVVFACAGTCPPGAGHTLFKTNPAFRTQLQECDKAVIAEQGWSIVDNLTGQDREDPMKAPAMLWALQVGLAAVWRDWGIEPTLVLGQGHGELAASTIRGTTTIRDAAAILATMPTNGGDDDPTAFALTPNSLLIELGHPTPREEAGPTISSLHPNEPEQVTILKALASAYTQGATVDWASVTPGGRYLPLPTYPWQRKRYWPTNPPKHAQHIEPQAMNKSENEKSFQ